jgi:hypothetical protein
MTGASRFLLGVARWIAGTRRADWIDAMAAETEAAGNRSTAWAAGCAWALLRDRGMREAWFVLAILLMPIAVFLLQFLLFFPVVWFSNLAGLPNWTFIALFVLLPLPFSFVLGRKSSLRRSLAGAGLSALAFDMGRVMLFWLAFGTGPGIWFEKGSHIDNMAPLLGWSVELCVWLVGAWLGSLFPRSGGSDERLR